MPVIRLLVLAALFGTGCASAPPVLGTPGSVPSAMDPPPDADGISLVQIHPNVWVHTSWHTLDGGTRYPANGLLVRDGDGLLLVDSAWGADATAALLDSVATQIGLPVRRAVVTHFHDDRVSGADVLRDRGVEVFATALTRRLAAAEGAAVPAETLDGLDTPGDTVRLGAVEVFYPGAGHTADNVVVYVPAAGVLFGGCAVHEVARQTAGNTADADLTAWPASLRRLRERYPDSALVVPGHGAVGGRELIDHSIALVEAAQR